MRSAGGSLERFARVAGPLLRKDVELILRVAEDAGIKPGAVLDAAGAALRALHHPR